MFALPGMTARAVSHYQQALALNAELGYALVSSDKRSEAVHHVELATRSNEPGIRIGRPRGAAGITPLMGYHWYRTANFGPRRSNMAKKQRINRSELSRTVPERSESLDARHVMAARYG